MMTIAEGLRRFRKEFHLTQKQVAASCGIGETAYQKYEYGTVNPSFEIITNIANAYHVSLDYLAGRSDNPQINEHVS